jgi:ComF family protein
MVLAFKHAGRAGLARVLAPHMARVGGDLLADGPLLIPVPLHRWRLFWRGYNQAALLARELGGLTGCPTAPDALRRVRMTRSLGRLGAEERRAVVAGVFAVRRARSALVAGRAVVLIDDVMTSGATLDGCARVLLACGAARVDALVAARVPLSRSD